MHFPIRAGRTKAAVLHAFQIHLTTFAAFLMLVPTALSLFYAGRLPEEYHIRSGETLHIAGTLPIAARPVAQTAQASQPGSAAQLVSLRLFGIFPIKTVQTHPTGDICLVPCGQPFGVRMLMGGVMVVGFGEVASGTGHSCPALDAGLEVGDIILAANHKPVRSTADFRVAAAKGEPMELTVMRGSTMQTFTLAPAYSLTADCCQTGCWVRDSAAGIGTLTYFDPETGRFGGLGHPICDPDTGEPIPLAQGEADAVTISGVIGGQPGAPGQLQGYFAADTPIGTLFCNSSAGIFGTLDPIPDAEGIPMALQQEVALGDAIILTTIEGTTPTPYTAEITSLDYTNSTQNLVIRVTDERLLAQTGGIVQGMSGSPILQNGKLVGAVTHVFVTDPAQGYGIFAENMYAQSAAVPQ